MASKKTHMNFKVSFKTVREDQKLLIHNWIAQDHLKKWRQGYGLKKN